MCVANDANDPCSLLIGDVDDGFLYALTNSTDDDGTAIETFIKTAYADKNSVFDKVWRRFSPESACAGVACTTGWCKCG